MTELNSKAMQEIKDGTLNIEYLSVKEILEKYGHLLTEKEIELLKTHYDGD